MTFRSTNLLADFERLTRGLNLGQDLADSLSSSLGAASFSGSGNVDAVRTAESFELHIDLPGIDPEQVDVTVDRHTLTVSAERSFAVADDAEIVHAGRRHGSFSRTFRLAQDLDVEQLSARSEHGVLVITVPRVAAEQPRKVQVNSVS